MVYKVKLTHGTNGVSMFGLPDRRYHQSLRSPPFSRHISPGKWHILKCDPNSSYGVGLKSTPRPGIILRADDFSSKITIFKTVGQGIDWRTTSRARGSKFQSVPERSQRPSINIQEDKGKSFDDLRKAALGRMKEIKKECAALVKLLVQVKVCPAQCNHLVKACLDGTKRLEKTYSSVSENDMRKLFESGRLNQIVNSLCTLLSTLESTKVLLQACGSKWCRMGLVLCNSLPFPDKSPLLLPPIEEENPSPCLDEEKSAPCPDQKTMWSEFDLVLKELSWNLDTIHHALQLTNDVELKWNEDKRRYLLVRNNVPVLKSAELEPPESEKLVQEDRKHFLSYLQDEYSLSARTNSIWTRWIGHRSRDPVAPILMKRLQPEDPSNNSCLTTSSVNQESVEGDRASKLHWADSSILPTRLVPTCYWINHNDLKFTKRLSSPESAASTKIVYAGTWCGHQVAIRILKGTTAAAVDKEAAVMLKVQHPNIVDFYGCAFTRAGAAVGPASGYNVGVILMELAQKDLRALITEQQNQRRNQVGSGPFHLTVAIDILLQIVAAVLHMHNCGVTHRDLKAENCLVTRRTSSSSSHSAKSSGAPDLWTVKLIDFELSKELDLARENHTSNTGSRRWTAPEVWAPAGAGPVPYQPKSADVYSFGMVCYEVTTGLLPFENDPYGSSHTELYDALREGKRPELPPGTNCPEGLKKIMSACWVAEDKATNIKRPDFKEIQQALWEIKLDLESKQNIYE